MPRVKLDYVVSFSSEDSENIANNLLANEVGKKKWLCNTGEPSCSVVLQLSKAVQIANVHIGACHAALVEVLVGRSEKPNDQFEVLVPSSVFLSPLDSRRGTGVERVRSFAGEQLGPARDGRWDRLRVVCSQPYNKHCKYGLSFIHIFEPEDKLDSQPKPDSAASVAAAVPGRMFSLDNFSSDEEDFRPGEMFANHRTSSQETSGDTGAQIRQATSQALKNMSDTSTKLVKTPITKAKTDRPVQSKEFDTNRHKDTLMYTDDDELPNNKIDKIVQKHKDDKELESKNKEQKESRKKETPRRDKLENSSRTFKDFIDDKDDKRLNVSTSKDKDATDTPSRKKTDDSHQKRNRDDKRHGSQDRERGHKRNDDSQDRDRDTKKVDDKRDADRDDRKRTHSDAKTKDKAAELRAGPVSPTPHTLLAGVAFALSGYENPRRARLRDAAVAMGARFERDWGPGCTHLICAFPNTPKLKAVRAARGACIAVLGDWLERCCETRRLLPWQWFATEPKRRVAPPANYGDDDETATECDTDDEIEKVLRKQKRQRTDDSPPPTNRDRSPRPQTSKDRSPKPHSSKDRSPKPHSSKDRSPKPHSSKDRSPKPHSSKDRSPKPHSSKDRSPKPHSSKDRSPKPHSSKDRSPKPHSSKDRSPKPHSSKDRSPKPHSSKDRSPKPHSSKDRSPKPHSSKDRSPKRHSSKDRSPKPQTSRDKSPKFHTSTSRETSPKPHSSKEESASKRQSLDYSIASTDSDVAFVKDERILASITINSDGYDTDEDKPTLIEKLNKKSLLPDFFEGYTFVIEEAVEQAGFDKELLSRYVRAYGGVVMDPSLLDSDSEVSFVLSTDSNGHSGGKRVRADWVWRCHEHKQLCDVAEYML